ncbi:MAG: hypothetical protein IKW03_03075 [Clostridia bacterium]|nr:hypothetical protein [Clostridia bacterium]
MKRNENGAIIIEATIILPFFMFAIITVLSIVNICFAQAKIGVAINETAKELSQYSYIYGLTGLNDKQAGLYAEGENARAGIDQMAGGVSTLFSSAASIGNSVSSSASDPSQYGAAYDSIKSDIEAAKGGYSDITGGFDSVVSDPTSLLKMLANEGIETVKSYLVSKVVPVFAKKHLLRSEGDNCEAFLKYLGVVPKNGSYLKGLDFGDSVLFLNGTNEIKIIVKYEIKVMQLLNIDIRIPFTQCAATKAWFAETLKVDKPAGGDGAGGSSGGAESTTVSDKDGIANGEDGGAASEETTKSQLKSASEYARLSTKNASSDSVVLGKYNNSEIGHSYIDEAIRIEATYFDMDNYDEVAAQSNSDFMWDINKSFLETQHSQGKTFYLTDNPSTATGSYAKEVNWLKQKGYTFEYNSSNGLWKAVKK